MIELGCFEGVRVYRSEQPPAGYAGPCAYLAVSELGVHATPAMLVRIADGLRGVAARLDMERAPEGIRNAS